MGQQEYSDGIYYGISTSLQKVRALKGPILDNILKGNKPSDRDMVRLKVINEIEDVLKDHMRRVELESDEEEEGD